MGSSQQSGSFGDPQQISSDNVNGLCLAISSSLFIGSSFIIKKKGLQKAAASGLRAVIVGEIANFAAYAFAPAVLVTPLGALSIIISAALAHMILGEKLHIFGIVGCVLCVVGSTTIVLHAPQERQIESVKELWDLATEPAFLLYATLVIVAVVVIIVQYAPKYGQTHIIAYVGVCSLVGSIGVMSVQALGIALKLTFSGTNQLLYPQTWIFAVVVVTCVLTQMNYLNKALDTFNTALVSPIYYVTFTSLTIVASVIMFKDWNGQTATQIITELCGFVTILSGTFLLHKTKDLVEVSSPTAFMRYPKYDGGGGSSEEGTPLKHRESMR
nr:probable magnesium transporter NIPA4 isoform X3 [Solanum lycopersicum]